MSVNRWPIVLSFLLTACDGLWNNVNQLKLGNSEKSKTPTRLPSEEWLLNIYQILNNKVEQLKPYIAKLDQS